MPKVASTVDSPVQALLDRLNESLDLYDVAAACYQTIINTQHGYEARFILEIDDLYKLLPEDCVNKFRNFRKSLHKIMAILYCKNIDMEPFQVVLSELVELIKQFHISEELEEEKSAAYCTFYIIEAIDAQLEINALENDSDDCRGGPLNQNVCRNDCFVYSQENHSFLAEIYKHGKEGFRKPLRPVRIGSVFKKLLILDKGDFCTIAPKITNVSLSEECKNQLLSKKYLRIASIPFIGYKTFNFCEENGNSVCNESPDGAFYVQYDRELQQENINDMLRLFRLAIEHKANIIIFPEFVMSGAMIQELRLFLKNQKPECLALVIAGTTYEYTSDRTGNNVMHIFDRRGLLIGKYYKFSPFLTLDHEMVHGASYGENMNDIRESSCLHNEDVSTSIRYLRNGEILSDPGKECTIVDIEGIGRILPAVCRDVTDGYYTDNLAKLFMPSLLLIPSWSSSVNSFHTRLSVLAETIHTTSVLCNCCNSVSPNKDHTGLLIYPQKQNSQMVAQERRLCRKRDCIDSHGKCKGCLHLIDIKCEENKLNTEIQHILSDDQVICCND